MKVMEGDKEAYLEEATKALKRQRKTIEDLEKEKKDLSRSLKSAKSRKNNRKDGENAAKLARLAEEQVNTVEERHEQISRYQDFRNRRFRTGNQDRRRFNNITIQPLISLPKYTVNDLDLLLLFCEITFHSAFEMSHK